MQAWIKLEQATPGNPPTKQSRRKIGGFINSAAHVTSWYLFENVSKRVFALCVLISLQPADSAWSLLKLINA